MTNQATRNTSALLSLVTSIAALSAVTFAVPVKAEGRGQPLNDRIAELCTASDVDLVGKRLAKDCRAAVRAQWQEEQRLASAKKTIGEPVQVALRK